MHKPKIVFVILHYETLSDTKKCIDTLLPCIEGHDCSIIIVDNGSISGRLIEIQNKYKWNKNIYFIYSKYNLGFAKGNNIGFKYAKYNLNAEIIILSNNDIVYEQSNMLDLLENKYYNNEFDVAGPRIISLIDNKNQNPVPLLYPSVKSINKRLIKYYILYVLSYINADILVKKLVSKEILEYRPGSEDDFQLHGACMFFTRNYIKQYDGLYDDTFMYGEESILKNLCSQNRFKMAYFDDIYIYHKEGSSTNKIYKKNKDKRQFYYKWNIHSCKLLKKIMKGSSNE